MILVCFSLYRSCDEEQELVSGEMKNNSRVEHPGREQLSERYSYRFFLAIGHFEVVLEW